MASVVSPDTIASTNLCYAPEAFTFEEGSYQQGTKLVRQIVIRFLSGLLQSFYTFQVMIDYLDIIASPMVVEIFLNLIYVGRASVDESQLEAIEGQLRVK